MSEKQPNGVSRAKFKLVGGKPDIKEKKLEWPPENTIEYNFREYEDLDLIIPLEENEREQEVR